METIFYELFPFFITVSWNKSESLWTKFNFIGLKLFGIFQFVLPVNFSFREWVGLEIVIKEEIRSILLSINKLANMHNFLQFQLLHFLWQKWNYFLNLFLSGIAVNGDKLNNGFKVSNISLNFVCINLNAILIDASNGFFKASLLRSG